MNGYGETPRWTDRELAEILARYRDDQASLRRLGLIYGAMIGAVVMFLAWLILG